MNNMRNIAQKCDPDNKGCDFWLFDNNRYAKIGYDELDGEGISSLGWKPFQIESIPFDDKAQPQLSKYRATKPGTGKTSKKKGTRK